ncbi:ABC transporter substrate-binding protein [Desulfosudis oleivorans]|uniref:Extracellular ligand-binding receptor n=1 Tax=Desulfosudis oleivorans (strain DSM 6200 / JCM 39069 / Hxd3) TaxID=96561 RepID=A8ZVT4_DESOH|nr:ABC transporter substrate-binding protein [Desulfosudis oleivorans]ABW66643.1 Extracellular ligand-binding receptor [Desulfosudis oleivorans Hxd3]
MKKSILATAAVLVVMLMCGGMLYAASDDYRVGCIFSVTGKASWLGEPEKKTAEMLAEKINAAGGINGHKLKLYIEDDQGDNTRAVNAAKKLINRDKVCAIIGPSVSGATMAILPVMQEAEIPLVSCAAAAVIVEPVAERKWIFKTPQKDSDAVRRIYEHMISRGIKDVGLITGTTGFGNAGRTQLKDLAPEYKMNIVADETYGPADTDMTAQLVNIRNAKAQAVINWSIVPAQSIVPKNMKQLNMTIPLYQSHGFGNIKYVEAAGEAAEGIIFPAGRLLAVDTLSGDNPQKALLAAYKAEYEARYNEPVSTFGGHAYDALSIVVKALEKAGDDPAKIRDTIETIEFVGTGGVFKFSAEDHTGLDKNAFEMLTVKDGKFVVLTD